MSIAHESSIQEQLLEACKQGRHDLIPDLLASGASLTANLEEGYTALHIAAKEGHTLLIRILIEYKANPNIYALYTRETPIFLAANFGQEDALRTLIELKGDASIITSSRSQATGKYLDDPSPVWLAATGLHANCVRILIEKGANSTIKYKNKTPLEDVCNLLEFLIDNASIIKLYKIEYKGKTPLETVRNINELIACLPDDNQLKIALKDKNSDAGKQLEVVRILQNAPKIRQEALALLLETNQATTLRGLCCTQLAFLAPSKDEISQDGEEIGNNADSSRFLCSNKCPT
jgi:hypothetical protein